MNTAGRKEASALLVPIRLLFCLAGGALAVPPEAIEPPRFLLRYVSLDKHELARVWEGRAVVRALETNENREVAVLGMVRVDVPLEFLLNQYRDIVAFKSSPAVLQIGKFGSPPSPEDLQSLRLENDDVEALKKCTIGDCKVKLSAAMMQRFRNDIDWSSPSRYEEVSRLMRKVLAEYVSRYAVAGNAALLTYDDKKPSVHLANEFRGVLAGSLFLLESAPEFRAYLVGLPQASPPDVETFLYWSKENLGLKPVLSITHVTIYRAPGEGPRPCFIASKQIYASHYFEASLGFTFLAEEKGQPGGARTWMLYLNRSRADGLRGWLSGLKRAIVVRRARGAMQGHMEQIKGKLEAKYRAVPTIRTEQ